jgi:hypothetical protein
MVFLVGAAVSLGAADSGPVGTSPDPSMSAQISAAEPASDAEEPTEILIEAPEPRYVAPTRRDRIGRIWAPVYINDKGPFRMVLDTGASRSGIIAHVAADLSGARHAPVMLQGATDHWSYPPSWSRHCWSVMC